MNKTVSLLKNLYLENKLSHVTLIETNNQSFCVEELLNLIKVMSCANIKSENHNECAICRMIEKKEFLNLFIVEPDGKNIKKEQMVELIKNCSKMPILSMNNIYIIKNAERLNSSSANTILKFIEEPFDNCYGFLLTNSKENRINTIKSRCEIYKVKYESEDVTDKFDISKEEFNNIIENIKSYLIYLDKTPNIIVNKEILEEKYKTREYMKIYFNILLDVIDCYINLKFDNKYENDYKEFEFLNNDTLENLINKKKIVINILNNLSYNLNIDLILDKFVIEMGEINE